MARVDHVTRWDAPEEGREALLAAFVSLLSFLCLLGLFFLRELDDNSLLSWRWVFGHVDAAGLFITLGLCSVAAYMMTTLGLPGPRGLLVLSLALGALFLNLPEVIIDSSRYFTQAKHLEVYGPMYFFRQWGRGIEAWTDLPFMPFLYGAGFSLMGEYRIVSQTIVLLMFSGAVYVTSLLGRDMFGDMAGRLSGVFLLSIPYLYSQVPLMMVDVPSMFFLVLSIYALRRGLLEGGLWAYVFAPVSIAMAFFTKYSSWPMLSIALPLLAVSYFEDRRAAGRCLITVVVFLLLALPVLYYYREPVVSQVDLILSYQRAGLRKWSESLLSTFFFQVHPFVTIAALASIPIAIRKRERWYIPLFWLILLVLIILGVRRIRYTIPLFPLISVMAAYAVSMLGSRRAVRSVGYSALVVSVVFAIAAYAPFLKVNSLVNLQLAGRYLDSRGGGTVSVRTMPQRSVINPEVSVPILDLYTKARIVYEGRMMPTLSNEEIEESSFRFTWLYRNPEYYSAPESGDGPALRLIVSPEAELAHDSGLCGSQVIEKYDINEGLFKFRPHVFICN